MHCFNLCCTLASLHCARVDCSSPYPVSSPSGGDSGGGCCASAWSSSRTHSLLPYLGLLTVSIVLSLILRFQFSSSIASLYMASDSSACLTTTCIQYGAVFRISLATFLFFSIHALALAFASCCCGGGLSPQWTRGWWLKILLWIVLLIVAYLIPDVFYSVFWIQLSRILGAFFLFLQVVILVDLAHSLNEEWTDSALEEVVQTRYKILIITMSLGMLMACLVLLVFFYIWYGSNGCDVNEFLISFTFIATFLMLLLSISERFSEKGGLLPGSIVTLYCYWLCYSGLSSDPSTCNTLAGQQQTAQLVIGLAVAALSIAYAGWSVATHASLFGVAEEAAAKTVEMSAMKEMEMGAVDGDRTAAHTRALAAAQGESGTDEETLRLLARRGIKFHLIMATCCMYMAMLLTNWYSSQWRRRRRRRRESCVCVMTCVKSNAASVLHTEAHCIFLLSISLSSSYGASFCRGSVAAAQSIDSQNGKLTGKAYDLSVETLWIKFAMQWLTMITYTWSVVAPSVCAGRDFS
jgi:hypothetical protein